MTKIMTALALFFTGWFLIPGNAQASGRPADCDGDISITVGETWGIDRFPCDPNGGDTLNLYMNKGMMATYSGGPVLNWRDRCDNYGGRADTYRKSGRLVRVCYSVDF